MQLKWYSYPKNRLPFLKIPKCAFCIPLESWTSLPSLTTFPRQSLLVVLKKPALMAITQWCPFAASVTVATVLLAQPPPAGSSTDTVFRGFDMTATCPYTVRLGHEGHSKSTNSCFTTATGDVAKLAD